MFYKYFPPKHHHATKFGGNDWVITLSFHWGFIKMNHLLLPPITLKVFFVRFSFSPFCVKTTILLSSFVSLLFVSFSVKLVLVCLKKSRNVLSLVRRPHSLGLYSHSRIKYFNSLFMNMFI